jgi:hypothetical protein
VNSCEKQEYLADAMILGDMYKGSHWLVGGPTFQKGCGCDRVAPRSRVAGEAKCLALRDRDGNAPVPGGTDWLGEPTRALLTFGAD